MNSCLLLTKVHHQRFEKKNYSFSNSLLWFSLRWSERSKVFSLPLISLNKFNLYSFYEKNHLYFNQKKIKENLEFFLKKNGVKETIEDFRLITQFSFLGYVFNPVSFYIIELKSQQKCAVVEVGNTLNEIKPFFVPQSSFYGDNFKLKLPKEFYVSPFLSVDNDFSFSFRENEKELFITAKTQKEERLLLSAAAVARKKELTIKNLLSSLVPYSFSPQKTYFFIHLHALILFLKKIPFFKKRENPDLQKGGHPWKKPN